MQVQALVHIKSSACTSVSWPILKAEHTCIYLHWLVSFRAVLVSSYVVMFACVCTAEALVHISMCFHILRAGHHHHQRICLRLQASRAVNISTCNG